jgi:hypothetical protein
MYLTQERESPTVWRMDALLRWDVIAFAFSLLSGIGLTLVSSHYRTAKVCFAVCAVIVAVTATAWLWALPERVATVVGLVVAYPLLAVALRSSFRVVDFHELKNSTRLSPGRMPSPPLPPMPPGVRVPDAALLVFLGSNLAWATRMPHTVLRMGSLEMLVVDRHRRRSKELVVTTLRIFDDRHDLIARVDEGEFWVANSNRYKRPDRHTLVVYDRTDSEVLRIMFLNQRAIAITGVFRSASTPAVVRVTPTTVKLGPMTLSATVMGEAGADLVI